MSVQVLVATMNQSEGDYSLIDRMNIRSSAVIINQCDRENTERIEHNCYTILWIDTKDRGLSKSRNLAIKNANADICLIADDDEILHDNYVELIEETFNNASECSIARFKIRGIEKPFKHYPNYESKLGLLSSMKSSSVELAFRLKQIKKSGVCFDESIGAGTTYLMGEENAFLWACLRKKMKIYYFPKTIADLHIGDSSWFKGHNKEFFIGRGAAFTAMGKYFSILLIIQFALRRGKLYKKEFSVFLSIKYMFSGRRKYLFKKEKKSRR